MPSRRHLMGAAALAAALHGAGLPAAARAQAAGRSYRIGAAVYGLKNEYAQLWVQALKAHPGVRSALVRLVVFDGRYDHLAQDGQFDTMITQKFDAAIYVPIDSIAAGAVIAKATAAGLPVIGSNGPARSDQLVSFIGSDDVRGGEMAAQAVARALGGKGNVVVLEGPVGQLGALQRWEGSRQALEQHPGIRVLERKTANWSRAEALNLMQNWITAHRGSLHGVIAHNDEMALGAVAALKAAGIDPKSLPVAGIDGVSDAIRSVAAGEMILSIRQDAATQAQGAMDVALRHLIGPAYQPLSDVWKRYPQMPFGDGTARRYDVPWTLVTQSNASQFLTP